MPELRDWIAITGIINANLARWRSEPATLTWSRLEPMNLTRGDLTPGAQVLLADPLWLLGRQWQFDELHGEDAGSPIVADIVGETAPLDRFLPGGTTGIAAGADTDPTPLDDPLTPDGVPLEVRVEAEIPAVLPLRVRSQLGLHLLRLLRAAGLSQLAAAATAVFPFPDPTLAAGAAGLRLVAGRVPDGQQCLAACRALDDGTGALTGLPDGLRPADSGDLPAAADVVARWYAWADTFLARPSGQSWNPHRLEYSFQTRAALSDGEVAFDVAEYPGGTLDWFHGELADVGTAPSRGRAAMPLQMSALPTPVRFAGMPSDRLFAFEDSAVYLGAVQARRADLARLAVMEFALAYSVDWFEVPLELPYGSVSRLDRLEVTDTFGVTVPVGPAREAARPGWTAFQSTPLTRSDRLAEMFVLAPSLPFTLQGEPLEEVLLFRDEMANLVWGVEHIVPDPLTGEAVDQTRLPPLVQAAPQPPEDTDAELIYRLMTSVPEHWIPLVPVRPDPTDPTRRHELERRPMVVFDPDGSPRLIHPRGTVLRTTADADPATDRLRLAEGEVKREGVLVTRRMKSARTAGGGSALWIGRRVQVGRGEGDSGLRFDTALPRRR